ncbi:MAG TPA: hypothetical protein VE089_08090 [Nitrososphaeraceae archaeon]|jgi:hypothetical protein|nr:hypothetical protein [Nitrososphaeraceae archaeon]
MASIFSTVIGSSKSALVLISVIVALTIVDSLFVNAFYGTSGLGNPGNYHLLLFISFAVIAGIINIVLMLFTKKNDSHATTSRPLLFRVAYVGTSAVQYAILLIVAVMILEMFIFHVYNKILSLLVLYLSHFWPAIILGVMSFVFVHWFRFTRSFSILIYGAVFSVIVFLILTTLPLLTEQFKLQPELIYPRDYTSLITSVIIPSPEIAFIYGLGIYVLPVMIISTWILTVSLLRQYTKRIGKKKFWLLTSIPLLYQLFTFIIRDANLVTDPAIVQILYSQQVQFIFGISYQIAGLFFGIAFLTIARRMRRKVMKNYLIISSVGIMALFGSVQPGLPFYAAYPPFGLATLLFLGLSSYMLLVGMIGIGANVSRDSELRREIYRDIEVNSDILKNMGTAELQREIERKVLPLTNKIKLADDMRDHLDPSEEDVKIMISEVLTEIHSKSSHTKPGDLLS